jgi:hypothetical protein
MAPRYPAPNADALYARELGRIMMTRFYFHLTSKQDNIPDDSGKELDTLIDAYEHARASTRYCFTLATTMPIYGR